MTRPERAQAAAAAPPAPSGEDLAAGILEVRRTSLWRRLFWGMVVGLAAGGISFGLGGLQVFRNVESISLDWRHKVFSHPSAASKDVVVVLIDEYSIQQMLRVNGVRFPWPRDVYVPLIQFLAKAGARAIAFDIIFADPGQHERIDQEFAEAARAAGTIVLAAKIETLPPGLAELTGDALEASEAAARAAELKASAEAKGWTFNRAPLGKELLSPLPVLLQGAAALGLVNGEADPDNILRRAELLVPSPRSDALLATLPLQAARLAAGERGPLVVRGRTLGPPAGGGGLELGSSGRPLIRFYGPPGSVASHNAYSIFTSALALEEGLEPVVKPSELAGKVVFLGLNAAGIEDIVGTPMGTNMPGTELLATVCANILGGEAYREPPAAGRLLILLGLGVLTGGIAFWAWRPLPAGAGVLVVLGAYVTVALVAFTRERGLVLDLFFPALTLGMVYATATLSGYFLEGKGAREVARAFGQYLSPSVIHGLMRHPERLRLGGESREIAVYFSDIKGFSSFSERMSDMELVSFLNLYLTEMSDAILETEGLVDKYIGDAIMAVWGAPQPLENSALNACMAVIEQRRRLVALNARFEGEGRPKLAFRTGITLGPATVGNMGSARRFSYTAMGDTVNLASRLEGANKHFRTDVLVSDPVAQAAAGRIAMRRIGRVRVVGIERPVIVHQLLGKEEDLGDDARLRLGRHHAALEALESGRVEEALAAWDGLLAEAPDPVLERLRSLARAVTFGPAPWDGVWTLSEKG